MNSATLCCPRIAAGWLLILLLGYPVENAVGALEESRSSLHTYVPSASNPSGPFHCTNCWPLEQPRSSALPQHATPRHKKHQHVRGARPHKKPVMGKPRSRGGGLRSLPQHLIPQGEQGQQVESWQVRAVDGDTIRYGTERIRIRGSDTPELTEAGGFDVTQRLATLLRDGQIRIVPHGHDVYGRMLPMCTSTIRTWRSC